MSNHMVVEVNRLSAQLASGWSLHRLHVRWNHQSPMAVLRKLRVSGRKRNMSERLPPCTRTVSR